LSEAKKNPFCSKNFYLPLRQHVHPPSHQHRALRVDFFYALKNERKLSSGINNNLNQEYKQLELE